ncbi:hypothetical protein [Bacillus cereus]
MERKMDHQNRLHRDNKNHMDYGGNLPIRLERGNYRANLFF